MQTPVADADLDRRKQVRVCLRADLVYSVQKYEGRTYHVVKDPVALRYFRFKEQEQFLLQFMDGKHTLAEAQKAFEQRFRPERMPLEDLEAFATQLLQFGLLQNESAQAGRLLYDRAKKRRRRTFWSTLLNLLSIRIPLFDPDRLLERMVGPLRFLFTRTFLVLSVAVMLAALGLVLGRWNEFVAKLPTYEEFFSPATLLYLWLALGLVKILHEFGHGLTCKAFGGEVHEMGLLFLIFSPCLYCSVSDSWILPSKWKRMAIGGAGIYVELFIASLATFVWWSTDRGTFLNHLCISLMVVCSVSTVLFNANPLMRFDGYYLLVDLLEIPNLQERSNRFVLALAMRHALGIQVPPERDMTRPRKVLFVFYAVASYIYRWVLTFSIVYFLYTFLKPYKLGSLGVMLATGALASMIGWPLFRLIQGVRKHGRLPDMKAHRVWLSASLLLAALLVVFVVPFPMRVRGLALIQVEPNQVGRVTVPESGGFLRELLVQDGERVSAGDELAILHNRDLEIRLTTNEIEQTWARQQQRNLIAELGANNGQEDRTGAELQQLRFELRSLIEQHADLKKQKGRLTLRAPRDGIVMGLRPPEEKGKWLEPGTELCHVGNERALRAVLVVDPADRSLIAPGRQAWIRVHGRGYNEWSGVVTEIAEAKAEDIPPQLSNRAGGEVPTQPDPLTHGEKPQQQSYLVAVRFEERDDAIHPGAMGRAKIVAPPQTLYWRFNRWLTKTFNWGL